jgi:hypothetical protein
VLTFVDEVVPASRPALEQALAGLALVAQQPPHLPFSKIPTLHFASVVLLDTPGFTPLLALESNFDGELDGYLDELVRAAGPWLQQLFGCCAGFPALLPSATALAEYLRGRVVKPKAFHIGNVGRSVSRIRQELALREGLSRRIDACQQSAGTRPADGAAAFSFIDGERRSDGRYGWVDQPHLRQTFAERVWPWTRLILAVVAATLLAVALLPVVLIGIAILLVVVKRRETSEVPVGPTAVAPSHLNRLAAEEDHQVQNHYASVTVVKPGWFRRATLRLVLRAIDLGARTSTNGTLSGIPSVHFAQWALVDRGRRLLFFSSFDGSWESYLDDFIDKASKGLTAIWINTEGFPPTRFLVRDAVTNRAAIKAFARRQQMPSTVRYTAYPDLTVQQIDRNSILREGLASPPQGKALTDWLRRW